VFPIRVFRPVGALRLDHSQQMAEAQHRRLIRCWSHAKVDAHGTICSILSLSRNNSRQLFRPYFSNPPWLTRLCRFIYNHLSAIGLINHGKVAKLVQSLPICFVPAFGGAYFCRGWKAALWDRFYTGAPQRQRRVRRAKRHSQESLRALARRHGIHPKTFADKTVARVAQTLLGGRSSQRAEDSTVYGSDAGTRGHRRRLSQAHAVAARRLSLCARSHDSSAHPFFPSPVPGASWHQPPARGRGRSASQEKFDSTPIGFFHIDLAEVRTAEGKLHLFVACLAA